METGMDAGALCPPRRRQPPGISSKLQMILTAALKSCPSFSACRIATQRQPAPIAAGSTPKSGQRQPAGGRVGLVAGDLRLGDHHVEARVADPGQERRLRRALTLPAIAGPALSRTGGSG